MSLAGEEARGRRPGSRDHHVLDYIFILRPTVIVGMWVFFMWGAALAASRSGGYVLPAVLGRDLWLALGAMTAAIAGGCLLNQIVDVETDAVNDKLFFLPSGIISMRAARVELAVVWVLAVALSLPVGGQFVAVMAAALVINITYSAPPVSAKSRFPLDMLWNGLGFGLVSAAAGWAAVAPLTGEVLLLGLVYTAAVAGVTASTTILDIEGDRVVGLRTTAAVLGERWTSWLTLALTGAAGVAGAVLGDALGLASLPALFLLGRAHITGRRADRILGNQGGVAIFALVAAVRAPVLIVLIAVVVLGSRLYYRRRFDISYPGRGTP